MKFQGDMSLQQITYEGSWVEITCSAHVAHRYLLKQRLGDALRGYVRDLTGNVGFWGCLQQPSRCNCDVVAQRASGTRRAFSVRILHRIAAEVHPIAYTDVRTPLETIVNATRARNS